jgi:hypothetical protein
MQPGAKSSSVEFTPLRLKNQKHTCRPNEVHDSNSHQKLVAGGGLFALPPDQNIPRLSSVAFAKTNKKLFFESQPKYPMAAIMNDENAMRHSVTLKIPRTVSGNFHTSQENIVCDEREACEIIGGFKSSRCPIAEKIKKSHLEVSKGEKSNKEEGVFTFFVGGLCPLVSGRFSAKWVNNSLGLCLMDV